MRIEPGSGPSVAACKWTQRGEGGIQRTKPYSYIFASVCARGARLPFFFLGGGNLFAGWFGWTLFPRVCAQGIDKLCECYLSYGRDSLCSHCALLRLVVSLGRVCIREREKRPRRPPPPPLFSLCNGLSGRVCACALVFLERLAADTGSSCLRAALSERSGWADYCRV